ncbi:hypothetical protein H8R18_02265 [Nanchangia anserum]|uniref:DUF3017 domain-containing protein n=1 Tax=Nanchangia anserum TaxID=2692125 RepID=A0A8I0GA70_9ACTO|nr:hypothetical protein [Nanchangia anserum]MBD3689999.1 hypothetical protein [Nanchangia anserum]QOX82200.1 hypothetical protein H8R18_02265 [Nanchangia anserum]
MSEPNRDDDCVVGTKTQRWIGIGAFVAIMAMALGLALANHPVFAARVFATLLAAVAIVRIGLHDRPVWFAARSWWADALVLLVLAAGIGYLSFYGGRVMPSLG